MPSLRLDLTPAYPSAIAAAAAIQVHARTPFAATSILWDRANPAPRTDHGWTVKQRADGKLWYTHVIRDPFGFPASGRSQPDPPEGIDPATIPLLVEQPDPQAIAGRLADALRTVRAFRAGGPLGLIPDSLIGVPAADLGSEARLAALYRLEQARGTLAAGHRKELLEGFLQALADTAPLPGRSRDIAPLRAMAAHFVEAVGREREDLTIDAPVAALIELFATAIARLDDTGAAIVGAGVAMWLPMAKGDPIALIDHVMMMCRKSGQVGLLEAIAAEVLDRAGTLMGSALAALDAAGYARDIAGACHAAWLADQLHRHLERHKDGVPGLVRDPLFARRRNVAEERLVRSSEAAVLWLEALRGAAFAVHRLDVLRRARIGGRQAAEAWAADLVETYFYYPRIVRPILAAADPDAATEPEADGGIPPAGIAAKAELLRALGLAEAG